MSLILFNQISPYKAKLLLIPQLIEKGHIKNTWNHLTESLEKSNHHAQKLFHGKTMRRGGNIYHADPIYMELFQSFCGFFQKGATTVDMEPIVRRCHVAIYGEDVEDFNSADDYLTMCTRPEEPIVLPIGRSFDLPLLGMTFHVVCPLPANIAKNKIVSTIKNLGGQTKKDIREMLNCANAMDGTKDSYLYAILGSDDLLRRSTVTKVDQLRDIENEPPKKTRRKPTNAAEASGIKRMMDLRCLAEKRAVQFLSYEYILEAEKTRVVTDPSPFILNRSSGFVTTALAKNTRSLFRRQRAITADGNRPANTVSTIASIKKNLALKRVARKYASNATTAVLST